MLSHQMRLVPFPTEVPAPQGQPQQAAEQTPSHLTHWVMVLMTTVPSDTDDNTLVREKLAQNM